MLQSRKPIPDKWFEEAVVVSGISWKEHLKFAVPKDELENSPFLTVGETLVVIRKGIFGLPISVQGLVAEIIAYIIYFSLMRISLALEKLGLNVSKIPLSIRDTTNDGRNWVGKHQIRC